MTYIELCLYEYKRNIKTLSRLKHKRNELMSVHAVCYDFIGIGSSAGVDVVANTVDAVLKIDGDIERLIKKIAPVRKLLKSFAAKSHDDDVQRLKVILVRKFFKNENNELVSKRLGISKSSYWRNVRKVLNLARNFFYPEE